MPRWKRPSPLKPRACSRSNRPRLRRNCASGRRTTLRSWPRPTPASRPKPTPRCSRRPKPPGLRRRRPLSPPRPRQLSPGRRPISRPSSARGAEVDAALGGSPVVRPIARPLKLQPTQSPAPAAASTQASLVELLRAAVGHRASTVYALVDSRPMMRVEGQIALVGIQAAIVSGDVERFIYEFAPRDLVANAAPEWTCVVPGVGRVRCVTFHDQSGAGLIFHLPSAEAETADEVGLGPELQALCAGADGLIVVAGPRSSGKSALLSAFVDVINSHALRSRHHHRVAYPARLREAAVVHQPARSPWRRRRDWHGGSRGASRRSGRARDRGSAGARSAGRGARRGARGTSRVRIDLGANRPGRDRAAHRCVPRRSPPSRTGLARRGAPRRRGASPRAQGRRRPHCRARSSPEQSCCSQARADGATSQLPIAIESGRSLGMKTMIDSLGALVRDGVVDIRTACGCAPDRAALILASSAMVSTSRVSREGLTRWKSRKYGGGSLPRSTRRGRRRPSGGADRCRGARLRSLSRPARRSGLPAACRGVERRRACFKVFTPASSVRPGERTIARRVHRARARRHVRPPRRPRPDHTRPRAAHDQHPSGRSAAARRSPTSPKKTCSRFCLEEIVVLIER